MAIRRALALLGTAVVAILVLAPAASATVTMTLNGSLLTVTGDANAALVNDTITVTWLNNNAASPYQVEDPAGVLDPVPAGCTRVNPNRVDCSRGGVAIGLFSVVVNGGAGVDTIRSTQQQQVLDNDKMDINAGDGNDFVYGSVNTDAISGELGDDMLDGGGGDDFVSGFRIGRLGEPDGPAHDGSLPASVLSASAGTDRVYGGSGSDHVTDGDAAATPGAGDTLVGGPCAAPCETTGEGPDDTDIIVWGHRTQSLTVNLGAGAGGAAGENDRIAAMEGVAAGSGNDVLTGNDANPVGLRDDSLRGNAGNDRLEGLDGDDELLGGAGIDTMIGGAGSDVFNPGGAGTGGDLTADGPDVMDGGTHGTLDDFGRPTADLIMYDSRVDALTIDLTKPNALGAPGENDRVTGIEDIMGGHAGDRITGDAGSNLISGDPPPPLPNEPSGTPPPTTRPAFGDDIINTRDDASDTVDCGGGANDQAINDQQDGAVACEVVSTLVHCNDGKDNDGDGKVDHPADPGCTGPDGRSEVDPPPSPACSDRKDNDGDGKVDLADPGCANASDNDETNTVLPGGRDPQCSDRKDNDSDGLKDYPADPGCQGAGDDDERDNPGPGGEAGGGAPTISGPSSPGRVRVRKDGSFTLPQNSIDCPTVATGASCSVRGTVSARLTARQARASATKKRYTLGESRFSLESGSKVKVRSRVSKKRMRTLKRLKSIRSTVTLRIVQGDNTVTRTITVTLQRPKGR